MRCRSNEPIATGNHRVKFPLNEPAIAQKRSQIDEYLDYDNGPGAQHLALATNDILPRSAPCGGRHRIPGHPGLLPRRPAVSRPHRRIAHRSTNWQSAGPWSTGTKTATRRRSSPSQWSTGPRCSSNSSSATARWAWGSGTSRPASKPSSASRPHPATSDPTGLGAPMHLMSSTENKPTVSAPDGAPSDGPDPDKETPT
jgi:hypothetical protein